MTTEEEHEHTDTPSDPPKQPDPPKTETKEDPKSTSDDGKSVREIVREEIQAAMGSRPTATSRASIEAEAERYVKEAAARVTEDEAHKAEHERLKAPPESPPEVMPKLRKVLFGDNRKRKD